MVEEYETGGWVFVIDTDKYAGNFERAMTAFCTGRTGECDVGREQAVLFHEDYPKAMDESGCEENCVFPSGYDSSGTLPGERFHSWPGSLTSMAAIALVAFIAAQTGSTMVWVVSTGLTITPQRMA